MSKQTHFHLAAEGALNLMPRNNSIQENDSIRPVVHGIGLYFLVSGTDSLQVGSIGSLLKLVALVPLALALPDIRRWKIRLSLPLVAQLLFWLLAVLSIIYSIDPNKTVSSLQALTLNLALVFCLGVMEQFNPRELQFMQRSLLAGGWFTILLIFLFSDISMGGRLTVLLGSRAQDQNYINGYFIYTFSYHCSQMLLRRKKVHILPTVFILSIVLLTGSRGALLAFLLVIFVHVCLLFANAKHKIRNVLLVALLMALLLAVFDLVLAQMPDMVAQRYSWDYIAENGTTGRGAIWRFFLRHYRDDSIPRMLLGHGYGTTVVVNSINGRVAHNLYLDNLITLGIVGMLLQLVIQGSVIRILLRRREYPLMGAYLGMIGMCLSLSLVSYKPMWNIMLLALAIQGSEHFNTHMQELVAFVKRRLRAILTAGILGGVTAYCVCCFLIPPVYEANAKMLVSSRQGIYGSITYDHFTSSEQLADTYAVIIRSRPVLEPVIRNLSLSTDVETLAKNVAVTSVNNTPVLQIAVRSENPGLALEILEQIVIICPTVINEIVEAGFVSTVEAPNLKQSPVTPHTNLCTVVSAFLCMAAAFTTAFIQLIRDNVYRSEADLQADPGLPVLGVIPDYHCCLERKNPRRRIPHLRKISGKQRDNAPLLPGGASFAYAEAYKALRTNLSFVCISSHCKKILITSTKPSEGKSTLAVNLAATLAESGAKVLLIDCDLRTPALLRLLRIRGAQSEGLTSLLTGSASVKACIFRHTGIRCDVLPAGFIPPNPVELLSSPRMKLLLEKLGECYDYILCDTSPVSVVADATALSRFCDGVILVVRQNAATREQVRAAKRNLEAVQANILGTVLSCYDIAKDTHAAPVRRISPPHPAVGGTRRFGTQ